MGRRQQEVGGGCVGPGGKEKRPDPIDIRVGARVRAWRLLAGMGQQAFARRLGVSFQQLQKYESGSNRISASRLYRIACILHVPIDAFFADSSETAPVAPPTREGLELVRAFHRIRAPSVRAQILALTARLGAGAPHRRRVDTGRRRG